MSHNESPSPFMLHLFEKTHIPEDTCYIDHLEICSLDGRRCGVDCYLRATGLKYQNGRAEEYYYDAYDLPLPDFFNRHANCIFLSDGALMVSDEVLEMSLETVIRNIGACVKIFPWMETPADLNMEMTSIAYEKLCFLHDEAQKAPPSLVDQISSASLRSGTGRTPQEQPDIDRDDCF